MSFIKEHSEGYPVKTMCRLLGVSVEGYRQHCQRQREPGARERTNAQLRARIVSIHKASRQTYGSPRITLQLKREGSGCGHNRVARLMKSVGIEGCQQRRYRVQTTQSDHDCPVAPNLANHTRKIIGWSMQATLKSDLVIEALHRAIKQQKPSRGLVHHSDRGVQYACKQYRKCLQSVGMVASTSRRGNCYDNATMESFFGTLKREQIQRTVYASRHQARLEVFSCIEGFYKPLPHPYLSGRAFTHGDGTTGLRPRCLTSDELNNPFSVRTALASPLTRTHNNNQIPITPTQLNGVTSLEIEIGLELGTGMGRGNRQEIELETWNATPFMSRLCRKD